MSRKERSMKSLERELGWLERGMWLCAWVALLGLVVVAWSYICECESAKGG